MIEGVVLTTARLEMVPLASIHLPDMLDLYADERVTRFLVPLDEAGHLRRLREAEEMWAGRGFGRVALYERAGGSFVGRGGLQYWSQFDEVEVGWALRAGAWRRGYASEAGAAWIDWAFAHLDVPYVTACIDPGNHASLSVAQRLGMSVRRTDVLHERQVLVFAIDCPEQPGPEPAPRLSTR